MKKKICLLLSLIMCLSIGLSITGCGKSKKEKVLIYTSAEDYRVDDLQKNLDKQFPEYEITIEYMPTGDHAAKLITEGLDTDCDITYDLEYNYLKQLEDKNYLYNLSDLCDFSVYIDDISTSKFYIPEYRNGGSIIINPDVLKEKNLPEPNSYEDLLDTKYKGLISMPNPKSSGTGYMFYKNLVNALGEENALNYFKKLTPNVLQYTSSGSGPVNALLQKEVAIGLGMTGQAVTKINSDKANLKIKYFKEGSPFSMYGAGIIKGKEKRDCVTKVFKYINDTYISISCQKFFPEKIYKDKDFDVTNFPKNITYGDMSNDTASEKERLLSKWTY